MPTNYLYLAVLPILHANTGLTEQTITLFPDRNFATEFFPDEVEGYVKFFKSRIKNLVGGHVSSYDVSEEKTPDGRVIVKVIQSVA